MPEHTSFFSYFVDWLFQQFPALRDNVGNLKHVLIKTEPVDPLHTLEPLVASAFVVLLVTLLALGARAQIRNVEEAVIPEETLTLRTFFEAFIGVFYDMMKDMMGPRRAKRYFPVVGTAACYIFFANCIGLFPGFNPPTSTWNITAGCALVVFLSFNYYGLKENGVGYLKHLCGPWIGVAGIPINMLVFVIEVISLCIRPITLSIRLMLNMAVDHLLVSIIFGMVALFLPIPILILSTLVCVVQVFVFCLLTSIYIALATEHEEHHDEHAHAKAHAPSHAEEHAEALHA